MILKSNFRDYYDGVIAHGLDTDTVYNRFTKSEAINIEYNHRYLGYICVAGVSYPYFRSNKDYFDDRPEAKVEYLFDYESAIEYMRESYYPSSYGYMSRLLCDHFQSKSTHLGNEPVERIYYDTRYTYDRHTKYGAEKMVIYEANPQLSRFDFGRVLDPYQCYQNIYSFLCNQARPIKPIPKLDDITMRDIKGFDKFSFRKEKTKR